MEKLPASASDPNRLPIEQLQTLEQLLAIQAPTLAAALTEASNVLSATFAAEKIDVFLFDAAKASLIAVGTSQTPLGRLQHQVGLDWLPLANGGRVADVFTTGQPYIDGRVDQDEHELRGIREVLGIRSAMIVPLDVAGTRRGVLAATSPEPERFSAPVLRFLQTVAGWVGLLVQRAELIAQLTQEASENARRIAAEELVTILAHDLGNHLTPLLGRAYMIRARAETEQRTADHRDADTILEGMLRLKRLIEDLLDVGRIDQGLFTVERRMVDLVALVRSTATTLETSQTAIEVIAPQSLSANVDGDRLRQALENLITNALRYAPDRPVVVALHEERREQVAWAVVRVRDQGPGIAPELVPQLMERYGRGARSSGLGLGLFLARRIAEAHGGALTVETALGKGTTFSLAVPLLSANGAG